MISIILYGTVKFVAYTFWGYCGYRLYLSRDSISLSDCISVGAARWGVGLGVGFVLFFLVHPSHETLLPTYLAVYVPVRLLEWGIIGSVFYKAWPDRWRSRRFYFWILAGVVISFLSDLTSPEMLQQGRFCVGRCLC